MSKTSISSLRYLIQYYQKYHLSFIHQISIIHLKLT